jgi:hypothetical protein
MNGNTGKTCCFDDFKVQCPTGSGNYLTLWELAAEISRRYQQQGHQSVTLYEMLRGAF